MAFSYRGGRILLGRGLPRPIDNSSLPNADGSVGGDIGAFEADPTLRLTSIQKVGADIRLTLSSMLGRTYRVESADTLPRTWNTVTNNLLATGSALQALDAGGATPPQRFYRVLRLP